MGTGTKEINTGKSGTEMVFEVKDFSGATVGATVTITGKVADGSSAGADFAAPETLVVLGQPDEKSKIACKGKVTLNTDTQPVVRIGEEVVCTIQAHTGTAATSGLTSNFKTGTVTGGTKVTSITDTGASTNAKSVFEFTSTAPRKADDAFTVEATTATNKALVPAKVTTNVIGVPSSASTIACVGASTNNHVRKGETVTCTITIIDDADTTTGLAADFTKSITIPATASQGTLSGGKTSGDFGKATAGATFLVTGVWSGGTKFSQGATSFVVVGTPNQRFYHQMRWG